MSGLPKVALLSGWECYDWRNAKTILEHGHPKEWLDIINVLNSFRLTHSDLKKTGGGKTAVAEKIDSQLYALDWVEHTFDTAIVVDRFGTIPLRIR